MTLKPKVMVDNVINTFPIGTEFTVHDVLDKINSKYAPTVIECARHINANHQVIMVKQCRPRSIYKKVGVQ